MKQITIMEMARAVERVANEKADLVEQIKAGLAIGPSPRDIIAGAVDLRLEAQCLAAAFLELSSLARLTDSNEQQRRKAG